ncbi:MAG: SAM-dependent methyltransferase [Chlamydiales bacterium]|jgi:SAM-dependent methyltransferase
MKRLHHRVLLAALCTLSLSPTGLCQESTEQSEDRRTWNRVFRRTKERGVKWQANEFLTEVVSGRHPGTALDIGLGQGRNSLFLAENGWDVTGFNLSDEAVVQAHAQAQEAGLKLEALQGDVNTFDYGAERWDLVVAMYMHGLILPRADEIVTSLAPGGMLVIEGFHSDLNSESVGGGYFGYATNELTRAFDSLRILSYEDRSDHADWGRSLAGDKPIVRFLARKPFAVVPELRGAYFGQTPPGMTPELFAPGLVSTPDSVELYEGRVPSMAVDMTVSPDGQQLTWLGRHASAPLPAGTQPSLDLWTSDRVKGNWSTARLIPAPVSSTATESYPCAVADGSLYFSSDREGSLGESDIWRAQRLADGSFAEPVNLGAPINGEHSEGDTWVTPDESMLVLTSSSPP